MSYFVFDGEPDVFAWREVEGSGCEMVAIDCQADGSWHVLVSEGA